MDKKEDREKQEAFMKAMNQFADHCRTDSQEIKAKLNGGTIRSLIPIRHHPAAIASRSTYQLPTLFVDTTALGPRRLRLMSRRRCCLACSIF